MDLKEKQANNVKLCCALCGKAIEALTSEGDAGSGAETCCCGSQTETEAPCADLPDDSSSLQLKSGDSIALGDNYNVIGVLGSGGMGTVYKVKDEALQKEFAIKMLHPEFAKDDVSLKRFKTEIEAASQLTHPNLVGIYKQGITANGSPYFVMDCIDGTSLAEILKQEKKLTSERTLNIFGQICDALAHAHMKGVVHRDLKPSNILITKSAEGLDIVKIVDFGVAKLFPNSEFRETQNLTRTGEVLGTPLYMSPEQCMGLKTDERSDIYSLGCVMYEALTGQPPFDGENPIQIIAQHLNQEPEDFVISVDSSTRKRLQDVIQKCLAKAPEDRYQNMDQMRLDLEKIRDGQKTSGTPKDRINKSRRNQLIRFYFLIFFSLISFATIMLLPAVVTVANAIDESPAADAAKLYDEASVARRNLKRLAVSAKEEDLESYTKYKGMLQESSESLSSGLQRDLKPTSDYVKQLVQFATHDQNLLGARLSQILKGTSKSNADAIKLDKELNSVESNIKALAGKIATEAPKRKHFELNYGWPIAIGVVLSLGSLIYAVTKLNYIQQELWIETYAKQRVKEKRRLGRSKSK